MPAIKSETEADSNRDEHDEGNKLQSHMSSAQHDRECNGADQKGRFTGPRPVAISASAPSTKVAIASLRPR